MKVLKKSITLILSLFLLLVTLFGCDSKNNTNVTQPITDVAYDLILDGKSDYKVVTADSPRGYEAYAGQELVKYVKEASSIELLTVTESEVTVNAASKLIIIGETTAAQTAGVKADKNKFGARGFVVKQIESNVYIVGGDTMGTLYGVYEFLHYQFGFEPYAEDEIALEKGVSNKKLMQLDINEIPDIAHVQSTHGYWNRINAGHLMRFNHFNEVFVNGTGQPWHNSLDHVPPSIYNNPNDPANYHPAWYTENGLQFHYTAHGDEKELQALQDFVYEKIVYFIERDFAKGKYYEQIGFIHEDYLNSFAQDDVYSRFDTETNAKYNKNYSKEKDSVLKLKEQFGNSYAAVMLIKFINPIQEKLSQYMKDNHDGRKMQITIGAYLETQTPPVKTDENGKYVLIDEEVALHPDANIMVAPIWGDYIHDYEDTSVVSLIEGWKVAASNISVWYYDYYFSTTSLVYLDSIYSLQSYFIAAYNSHATWLFFEGSLDQDDFSVFKSLRAYLISKLGWDVHADVHALTDAFFTNYYKDAAPYMKQYFDELTTYCAYLKETTNISGVCGSLGANDAKYWNKGSVLGWLDLIDKAYAVIEPLKNSDIDLYNKLYNRILCESISPRYILLQHYSNEVFTDEMFVKELLQWKLDCKQLCFTHSSNVYFQEFAPSMA